MTGRWGGPPGQVVCLPVDGIGEVTTGDDLGALLAAAVELADGDVLVVTSKILSKAEGRVGAGRREDAVAGETDRVLATRGRTSIVRTHHGLVLAAAGVDASNTDPGTVLLLPRDPDASARALRVGLADRTGRNVAVLVTDTAGRAWRNGQTDIAIGAAGLEVLHDHAGLTDAHGNELAVTEPAVADELAAAADLVKRKLDRRPAAVVRGLGDLVLPPGEHGPGAVALVRAEHGDMFGLGAREAVLAALRADDARGFGAPCPVAELAAQLSAVAGPAGVVRLQEGDREVERGRGQAVVARLTGSDLERGAAGARLEAAAFALGWPARRDAQDPGVLRFGSPAP